jgi:vancomycin resistance protein YoaR
MTALVLSKGFYKGVYVEEINLSGLTPKEAKVILDDKMNSFRNNIKIILKADGKEWIYSFNDISLHYLTDKALLDAYNYGRTGNIFQRALIVLNLRFNEKRIYTSVAFDKDFLLRELLNIKSQLDRKAKNAKVLFEKGSITYKKEVQGRILDADTSYDLIEKHIMNRDFSAIELSLGYITPKLTNTLVKQINGILSVFSTSFNPYDENRVKNLEISCSRVNGTILLPGEVFSMDKVLGPRTYENGYRDSKVILNSEYVDGIGGGICQITSTLYDAVLKYKLEIVERQHHSIASLYVGPGQDATIADNLIDFKFKNNKAFPIYISAVVSGSIIKVSILGKENQNNYSVRLVPKIIEEYPPAGEEYIIDNSVPDFEKIVIQKPKNGLRVILYRETYDISGNLIQKEKISDDTYKPAKLIYKVNENYIKNSIDKSD